jgi:hypothetical protein
MKEAEIKQLLERYWQCETSIEEERQIGELYASGSIPDEWKKYRSLYVWKSRQSAVRATSSRTLMERRITRTSFYPALRIAASVLVVLTLGIGVHTYYRQEKKIDQLLSGSSSETMDARKDSTEVMAKATLQTAPERDSIPEGKALPNE